MFTNARLFTVTVKIAESVKNAKGYGSD